MAAEVPGFTESFDDPRVTSPFCRRLRDGASNLTLVGVVHDHPASVGRVEAVLERCQPAVLALELPPSAISLYRAYADGLEPGSTPRFGGEMSAAIARVPDATVVGIDAPNWTFCRRLATRLVADRADAGTARTLAGSVAGAARTALACRFAATVTDATSMTVTTDEQIEYACTEADPPARQAAHERAHVAGIRALVGGATPPALAYRDEARESCMVDRLAAVREEGEVVAVVGVDHLDPLAEAFLGG